MTEDVQLIVEVLNWAYRRGMTVPEAVQDLLYENECELRAFRQELRTAPRDQTTEMFEDACERVQEDIERIKRLMRMFASWRTPTEFATINSSSERT